MAMTVQLPVSQKCVSSGQCHGSGFIQCIAEMNSVIFNFFSISMFCFTHSVMIIKMLEYYSVSVRLRSTSELEMDN